MSVSARRALLDPVGLDPHEECLFFNSIMTVNGVWKATAAHRMDDLNACFAKLYRGTVKPRIMDVGASSGLSTVEWRDDLIRRSLKPCVTATDLMIDGYLKKMAPYHFVLTDSAGRILQHEIDGQVIRPEEMEGLEAGSRALQSPGGPASRLAIEILKHYYRLADRRGWNQITVKLISAAARSMVFVQDDVLGPPRPEFCRGFDVLRVANLLNQGYFSPANLAKAVANLKLRLKGEDSMLIVNRTHPDGANHASFFALNGTNRFQLLERLGQGSEIEAIVLSS